MQVKMNVTVDVLTVDVACVFGCCESLSNHVSGPLAGGCPPYLEGATRCQHKSENWAAVRGGAGTLQDLPNWTHLAGTGHADACI